MKVSRFCVLGANVFIALLVVGTYYPAAISLGLQYGVARKFVSRENREMSIAFISTHSFMFLCWCASFWSIHRPEEPIPLSRFDHYCSSVGRKIALHNHKYFLHLLFWSCAVTFTAALHILLIVMSGKRYGIVGSVLLYPELHTSAFSCFVVNAGFCLVLLIFFAFHMLLVSYDTTTVEFGQLGLREFSVNRFKNTWKSVMGSYWWNPIHLETSTNMLDTNLPTRKLL